MREPRELDTLYQDIILDHYRTPRNSEPLDEFDTEVEIDNPFCGDEVKIQLQMNGGRIEAVSVTGQGCSISQSSASLMGESIKGRSLDETREQVRVFKALMNGEQPSEERLDKIGDLVALQGVRRFPVRIKCALLGWSGLEEALEQLEKPEPD